MWVILRETKLVVSVFLSFIYHIFALVCAKNSKLCKKVLFIKNYYYYFWCCIIQESLRCKILLICCFVISSILSDNLFYFKRLKSYADNNHLLIFFFQSIWCSIKSFSSHFWRYSSSTAHQRTVTTPPTRNWTQSSLKKVNLRRSTHVKRTEYQTQPRELLTVMEVSSNIEIQRWSMWKMQLLMDFSSMGSADLILIK